MPPSLTLRIDPCWTAPAEEALARYNVPSDDALRIVAKGEKQDPLTTT